MLRQCMLTLALAAVACNSDAPTDAPATQTKAETPEAKPAPLKFDKATLTAEAVQVALVPSPAEMQKALSNAGLSGQLAKLVTDRDITTAVENKDQVAVRTGVVLAELVLTVKSAEDAQQVARLGRLKEGFASLGAGDDVVVRQLLAFKGHRQLGHLIPGQICKQNTFWRVPLKILVDAWGKSCSQKGKSCFQEG